MWFICFRWCPLSHTRKGREAWPLKWPRSPCLMRTQHRIWWYVLCYSRQIHDQQPTRNVTRNWSAANVHSINSHHITNLRFRRSKPRNLFKRYYRNLWALPKWHDKCAWKHFTGISWNKCASIHNMIKKNFRSSVVQKFPVENRVENNVAHMRRKKFWEICKISFSPCCAHA